MCICKIHAFYGYSCVFSPNKRFSKKCKKGVDTQSPTCYNLFLSGATDTDKFPDANVAQSVEQLIRNQQVKGSSPFIGSIFIEV